MHIQKESLLVLLLILATLANFLPAPVTISLAPILLSIFFIKDNMLELFPNSVAPPQVTILHPLGGPPLTTMATKTDKEAIALLDTNIEKNLTSFHRNASIHDKFVPVAGPGGPMALGTFLNRITATLHIYNLQALFPTPYSLTWKFPISQSQKATLHSILLCILSDKVIQDLGANTMIFPDGVDLFKRLYTTYAPGLSIASIQQAQYLALMSLSNKSNNDFNYVIELHRLYLSVTPETRPPLPALIQTLKTQIFSSDGKSILRDLCKDKALDAENLLTALIEELRPSGATATTVPDSAPPSSHLQAFASAVDTATTPGTRLPPSFSALLAERNIYGACLYCHNSHDFSQCRKFRGANGYPPPGNLPRLALCQSAPPQLPPP
jgi:hypothetical protein